ncbi:MAG: hypothetical protein ACPGXL_06410 [Chitinophagales bacterium]
MMFQANLHAQITNRLQVEMGMARFAKNIGVTDNPEHYDPLVSFTPDVRLNYAFSKKWNSYLGIRPFNIRLDNVGGLGGEDLRVRGAELHLGTRFSPNAHKKVFLSYGVEIFRASGTFQGSYLTDVPPYCYEVNHKKNFLGFAPSLMLNIKLGNKVTLFVETRKRFGTVRITPLESTQADKPLYGQEYGTVSYWADVYEPISAMGLRLVL